MKIQQISLMLIVLSSKRNEIRGLYAVWTNWTPGVHTVYFEGCYIVYNENKRRTKTKETECEKNELIKNTSYCNHCI